MMMNVDKHYGDFVRSVIVEDNRHVTAYDVFDENGVKIVVVVVVSPNSTYSL